MVLFTSQVQNLDKNILIADEYYDESYNSYYDARISKTVDDTDKNQHRRMMKEQLNCQMKEIVDKFFEHLPPYMVHLAYYQHQAEAIRKIKSQLGPSDLMIYIDFSENYNCKYAQEIQTVNFSGSRIQITIHMGCLVHEGEKNNAL